MGTLGGGAEQQKRRQSAAVSFGGRWEEEAFLSDAREYQGMEERIADAEADAGSEAAALQDPVV